MPTLHPADEDFLATAPERYSRTFRIARPASAVWAELVSDTPLHWCRGLSLRWTSARPLGLGATREAKVLGVMTAQESFFVWEEGRRHAFTIVEGNLPLFRRFAEDFVVEAEGAGACRFTWTAAIEPAPIAKPGRPLNALLFRRLFGDTRRHFDAT